MGNDMFVEAENNFSHAEKTMMAFWNIIKKPFIFVLDKASDWLGSFFDNDKTATAQLSKLPL